MKIGIIGGGSLGLLFAGKCVQAEAAEVYVITRTIEQQQHLQQHGLQVKENGVTKTVSVHTVSFEQTDHAGISMPQLDWLFVFVKQQHIDDAFSRYLTYWTEQGVPLLCFQNGIGHVEQLAQTIPEQFIFTAVTSEAALRLSPNEVQHTGQGETWIGHSNEQYSVHNDEQLKIIKVLQHAGFDALLSKNIKDVLWRKLLINAVINPLTAILKVRNGELLASPYRLKLMRALYDEGFAVAESAGINVANDGWDELVAICEATARNRSSMLQDVLAGRMTEIEWINGALIRVAEQQQLSVPTHRTVYHLLKGIAPPPS